MGTDVVAEVVEELTVPFAKLLEAILIFKLKMSQMVENVGNLQFYIPTFS
jgi:hypothetical protein